MIHVNGKDYLFAKCTGYGKCSLVVFIPMLTLVQGIRMVVAPRNECLLCFLIFAYISRILVNRTY